MAFERWGSLSVDDHVDTRALVANVLLYDRLIIPVMTPDTRQDEFAYWQSHGWAPELQATRVELLADLAVQRPWNDERRRIFSSRFAQLSNEQQDVDAYHLTRRILAQETLGDPLPEGVNHVQVIAAYNSTAGVTHDFQLTDTSDHLAAQAFLLTRRMEIPDLPDVEDSLRVAIDLSRDAGFRAKRADLFDWQQTLAARGIPPRAAIDEIAEMTNAYNALVKQAGAKTRQKLAFTVFGIGLGIAPSLLVAASAGIAAAATGGIFAVGSAALALVQFVTHDREPVIEAGNSRPAAMFHDVETHVGVRLARVN